MYMRKATVIASLKQQVTGKKELENGMLKLKDCNETIDQLTVFIKTERGMW